MEEIPKEAIKAIDRLYWSPGERASSVLSLLDDIRNHLRKENLRLGRDEEDDIPSNMDLLCFAVEYTGIQAIAIGDEEFIFYAKRISRWLYSAHYSNPAKLWGEPDRKEEEDDSVSEEGPEVCGSNGGGTSHGSSVHPGEYSQVQGDSEGGSNGDVPDDDTA